MYYISNKIQKVSIPNKGLGYIAASNIKKGEILIKDIPFTIPNNKIYSDIFQLIYEVIINEEVLPQFMKLQPKSLTYYNVNHKKVLDELDKVVKLNGLEKLDVILGGDFNSYDRESLKFDEIEKIKKQAMYKFFTENYNTKEILLLCAKYMCNAFNFNNKPALLLNATILNHSCIPNTIFGEMNGQFIFKAIRDISKGEEIYDNYIDITLQKQNRQKHLLEQYGFVCSCIRCCETNDKQTKKYDEIVIGIEKDRLGTFGFTKSQKC